MGTTRFDIEKFTGENDFGLWRLKMKAILVQNGLLGALTGVLGVSFFFMKLKVMHPIKRSWLLWCCSREGLPKARNFCMNGCQTSYSAASRSAQWDTSSSGIHREVHYNKHSLLLLEGQDIHRL